MDGVKLLELPLDKIKTDGGTQTLAATDYHTAEQYAECMLAGDEFPPGDVFFDGSVYLMAAGFKRHLACGLAKRATMLCRVHPGGRREAILFGIKDNRRHGLRPSPEDRRRQVTLLLTDPEWSHWSDSEIVRTVAGCDSGSLRTTVATIREQLAALTAAMGGDRQTVAPTKRTHERNGTPTTYDVTGHRERQQARQQAEEADWLGHAAESLEQAREDLTRVSPDRNGVALVAVDLALCKVRELAVA